MSQRSLYLLIAVALLFGAIKGLKNVSFLSPRSAQKLQQIDWKNADFRPYQRTNLEDDPVEVEAAQNRNFKLSKTDAFSNTEIGAAKKNANPVVAKADTKDKKKKKKKKKPLAKGKPGSPFSKDIAQKPSAQRGISDTSFNPPPSGAAAMPVPEPQNDEEKSFEEWARLLLARPNKQLTDRFIREFQSNLVTPNVFYAILDLMFQEKDPAFKELAVRAAGAFTSIQSYEFLLMVISKEPSGAVTTAAQKQLYEYEQPSALHVLQVILTTRLSDETALTYALQSLESSISKYLLRANENNNEPDQVRNYKQFYLTFVNPLKAIIEAHADNNFGAMARRSLERIQSNQTIANIDDPSVVAGF